jgi:hypothetical protein
MRRWHLQENMMVGHHSYRQQNTIDFDFTQSRSQQHSMRLARNIQLPELLTLYYLFPKTAMVESSIFRVQPKYVLWIPLLGER